MISIRRSFPLPLLALAIALLGACDRSSANGAPGGIPVDTAATEGAAATSAAEQPVVEEWPKPLGPFLLVTTEAAGRANLLAGDSAFDLEAFRQANKASRVFLFGPDGRIRIATLGAIQASNGGCYSGAISSGGAPLKGWTVGFSVDSARPITIDSIASIGRADSARLVTNVLRLASNLPDDSTSQFAGLPYLVVALSHFKLPGDTQVVVATLRRQLNVEAMPLEERSLIIAEEDPSTLGELAMAYSERGSGDEETIETRTLLGAALVGGAQTPMLVLERDFGDGVAYGFLERTGPGAWRVLWTSPRRRCS